MFCSECGTRLAGQTKFCSGCDSMLVSGENEFDQYVNSSEFPTTEEKIRTNRKVRRGGRMDMHNKRSNYRMQRDRYVGNTSKASYIILGMTCSQ